MKDSKKLPFQINALLLNVLFISIFLNPTKYEAAQLYDDNKYCFLSSKSAYSNDFWRMTHDYIWTFIKIETLIFK